MIPSPDRPGPPDPSRYALNGPSNMSESEAALDVREGEVIVADKDGKAKPPLNDAQLLDELRTAESAGSSYAMSNLVPKWQRSYNSYRNRHHDGSKYSSTDFRNRSSVFKPKTRSSVRKGMAAGAASLFASADVVKITASDDGNPQQVAAAALKQELMNYRLSRTSGKNGIAWFQTCMGAEMSATITGVCVSEQTWRYEEKPRRAGAEQWSPVAENLQRDKNAPVVMYDRPEITLYPQENVIMDPTADWIDPAQSAGYIILRIPMRPDDVMKMLRPNEHSVVRWKEGVTHQQIVNAGATSDKLGAKATRQAREGQTIDRLENANTATDRFKPVWVYKTYMMLEGDSYVFWSVGTNLLLSELMLVEEVYPEQFGFRPMVVGFAALEPHTPFPMSPVESWASLQQEANDITNLRLDQMKHVVQPSAKVKRGQNVDLNALMRRGPNTPIMVKDQEDIEWDRPPDVPASAYQEANYINTDFDDLAGSFGGSSVQQNRALNETVGGMKLLASAAGSVTQFDLRVFVETWVEPVLRQLLKLEERWESDETILAICGEKAQLFPRFGIDQITDRLLMLETTLRVDAGLGMGSPDPMEDITKLSAAADTAGKILLPFLERQMIQLKPKENGKQIINEIFSKAGYRDGGERFFDFGDPNAPQKPPMDPRAQAEAAKIMEEAKKLKLANDAAAQKLQIEGASGQQKLALGAEELKQKQAQTVLAEKELVVKAQTASIDRAMKEADLRGKDRELRTKSGELNLREQEGRVGFQERRMAAAEGLHDQRQAREQKADDHKVNQRVKIDGAITDRDIRQSGAKVDTAIKTDAHRTDKTIKSEAHEGDQKRADENHAGDQKRAAESHKGEQKRANEKHEGDQTRAAESHETEKKMTGESHRQSIKHAEDDHTVKNKQADAKAAVKKEKEHESDQDAEIRELRAEVARLKKQIKPTK